MERQSSVNKRLVLGGVVALGLAVAAALFLGRASSTGSDAGDAAPQVATSATAPEQTSGRAAPQDSNSVATSPSPNDPVLKALQRPPLMPAEVIEQILKEDKKLGQFMHYHKTVLLDEQGRDEYRKLLSDPEIMKAMAKDLMEPGRGEVEPKEHYQRLMQIDYLDAALTWKDNPQRQQVIELTGQVILTNNFSNSQDADRRQMLAGGKMELYRLMYEQDVSKALDLVAQAKGTPMEKLVSWMAEENLRRRAREEQLRAEMQEMQTKGK